MNNLIDASKKAINIILHPSQTQTDQSIKKNIIFYYNAALLPGILTAVLSSIFLAIFGIKAEILNGWPLNFTTPILILIGVGIVILDIFILIPIFSFIDSVIFQLFAKKIFKIWAGDISKTYPAVLYGNFPAVFFIWLTFLPKPINFVIEILVVIWAFVILVIILSKQQKISVLRAIGGVLLSAFMFGLIIAIISILIMLGIFI